MANGFPLAFAHLMKTAGQTMRDILRRNFGAQHCDTLLFEKTTARDWRWMKVCYPRIKSIAGHCITPCDSLFDSFFPKARFFTFLREPVSRTISHYQFLVNGGHTVPSFEVWLEENRNFMTKRLAGTENAQAAIDMLEEKVPFVGLMEHFDESLLLWRHWTGLPNLEIRYHFVNRAPATTTKENILSREENLDRIRGANEEDAKLYGYLVEQRMERQRSQYGSALADDLAAFQDEISKSEPPSGKTSAARLKRNLIYRTGLRSPKADRRYS
ncbi:MAG: sulfotransferase family 2 domain-containing protein [Verrucomicrobiales bacterium]|nr:sulfotransferase family 2 domain-containing protein [Verrucomicrobiales bacterium]